MGPPSLNGGNAAWVGDNAAGEPRLQWGRRLSTAETQRRWGAAKDQQTLQWGRRLSTAETGWGPLCALHVHTASMGPPSLNGGNATPHSPRGRCCGGFNGAAVSQRRKQPVRREALT